MNSDEILIFGVIITAILIKIGNSFSFNFPKFPQIYFSPVLFIILGCILFIILNIIFHRWWLNYSITKREKKEIIQKEIYEINSFLKENLEKYNYDTLSNYLLNFKKLHISKEIINKYENEINQKMYNAGILLNEKKHEEYLDRLQRDIFISQKRNEELDKENREKELENQSKEKYTLKKLDSENQIIYERDKLKDDEVDLLIKNGFISINEYDPISQENKNFLIKKVMNHSNTHTFLVYRIEEIIKQYLKTDSIIHQTKDADLTFKIESKTYAIEVETGTLLSKAKQLNEKVKYLNEKYKNRWCFVVSNKNLIPKYKKFGVTIPRNEVVKYVQELADFYLPIY